MPSIVVTSYQPNAFNLPVDWSGASETFIVAQDGAATDNFGASQISESASSGNVFQTRDGTYLFVGAPSNDLVQSLVGRVYVFEKIVGVWTHKQFIDVPPTPVGGEAMGYNTAASFDGTHVIIGGNEQFWYFENVAGTWIFRQNIPNPNGSGHNFGISVSISDDGLIALIGAYAYDGAQTNQGRLYSYTRVGAVWSLDQTIDPPNILSNGRFGGGVALAPDGTHFIVGQPEQASTQGRVYAYDRTGGAGSWTLNHELAKTISQNGQRFGRGGPAMTADGNTVIIGTAHLHEGGGAGPANFVGGVLVYTRTSGVWSERQLIQPSTIQGTDLFGDMASIGISNDGATLTVGAFNQDSGKGAAFVYTGCPGSYIENARMSSATGDIGESFGRDTMLRTNDEVFIGAGFRNSPLTDQGAVYVYEISNGAPPCTLVTQTMDMENADPLSYLPFFDWQGTVGQFDLFQQFLVLDNGAKSNTPQEGLNYLRIGRQYTYSGNSQLIRSIRFSVPSDAISPVLSLWYRQFWAQSDTLNIFVDRYPDGTYIGLEDSNNILTRFGVGFGTTREYTWSEATAVLVPGKFYEINLEYFYRSTNPNFPSDQRPTAGGVVDATHNLGECLLIDNITVEYYT